MLELVFNDDNQKCTVGKSQFSIENAKATKLFL